MIGFRTLKTHYKLVFSILVMIGAILFQNNFELCCNNLKTFIFGNSETEENFGLYSSAQLGQYNGIKKNSLYLAVLGTVFDVSKGGKYYGQGAPYHYFIGKDGSRALVTGDFKDESKNKDHVMDLSCNELLTLSHWNNTFQEKYGKVVLLNYLTPEHMPPLILRVEVADLTHPQELCKELSGLLIGRYYDQSGKETTYLQELNTKIEQCEYEKEVARKEELKYPPCNMAWSADEGTRVWCTKTSGGVARNWVGVPRQLYSPGEERPRCVCINIDKENSLGLHKEYDNCPYTSTECNVDTS